METEGSLCSLSFLV